MLEHFWIDLILEYALLSLIAGLVVQTGDMVDRCSDTWLTVLAWKNAGMPAPFPAAHASRRHAEAWLLSMRTLRKAPICEPHPEEACLAGRLEGCAARSSPSHWAQAMCQLCP